ncbi:response regulator receiver domain [uncultured Draconibacterium sp.]|uniref:response regulator receiver domain n=1 Tax=uncultured Draconibacterium sp. TaxID=1573823 RepID=UPI0029C71088|nr:response regulator receiver domain [uncultured Draconibacterium sp.]
MNNLPEYQELAQEIIAASIKKAIFVDDNATLPFSKESISDDFCSDLFQSFNQNNSVIDFFPYTNEVDVVEKILTGRNDLIILDWELSEKTPKYKNTLEIIRAIISNESPHFLCIYTNEESSKFSEILLMIKAHLNYYESQIEYKFDELPDFLDEFGIGLEDFSIDFDEIIFNYLLASNEDEKGLRKRIISELRKLFGKDFKAFNNLFPSFIEFCYRYKGFTKKDHDLVPFYTNSFKDNNCIVANNTIILVVQKKEIKPESFISGFSNSILNVPHSYLTLVSLDYRNKFLQQSSFLGKELQRINENAFYHHMIELGVEFENFIQELWKYDNTSFLNSFKSKVIENFEKFKNDNGIEENIDKQGDIYKELAKLNSYYNIAPKLFNSGRILFGDIFFVDDSDIVLLCITAHCDCLRPQKINNNFFFIEGKINNLKGTHLKDSDSGFKSFILIENEPKMIDWGDCKPFTLHIPEENNDKKNPIVVLMNNQEVKLTYINTLKENYAQRISNNAFGYASRVGISFAKWTQ